MTNLTSQGEITLKKQQRKIGLRNLKYIGWGWSRNDIDSRPALGVSSSLKTEK